MDSKNIFCFVCTELQNPLEIYASRLEYPLKEIRFVALVMERTQQWVNCCLETLQYYYRRYSVIIEDTRGTWYIADVFALEPLAVSQENHFGHPEDSLAFMRSVGNWTAYKIPTV